MKFALSLLALAATVYAQNVTPAACLPVAAAVPTCALSCISSAASRANCGQFDLACQCGTASSAINSYAQGCVIAACTPIESALAVANSAAAVCSCVATAPGGGSAEATTSAGASASGSASTSAATSAGTSAATSGPTASSGMTMATGSGSSRVTSAPTSGATSAAGNQTTIGPATTESLRLAGAANVVGPAGGIAAALLGLAAWL